MSLPEGAIGGGGATPKPATIQPPSSRPWTRQPSTSVWQTTSPPPPTAVTTTRVMSSCLRQSAPTSACPGFGLSGPPPGSACVSRPLSPATSPTCPRFRKAVGNHGQHPVPVARHHHQKHLKVAAGSFLAQAAPADDGPACQIPRHHPYSACC